jgi:hypothetical protein
MICRQGECCVDDADPNARCVAGSACVEGVCAGVDCGGKEDACAADADCCGSLACVNATCQGDGTEVKTPDTTGGVTTLPETGRGIDGGGIDPVLGIAIGAGVASFLAGKRLRRNPEQSGES